MPTIAMSLLLATLAADRPVEIIAHRGESADAPENTLAAFRLAWQRKVTSIELDVHLAKDGTLVVCHDPDTKRTTSVFKEIKTSNWEQLKDLDAGRWKARRFVGERLPTLAEALATLPAGGRCFIEIKVGPEAVPALVKTIKDSGKAPEQLVIISFNAATVAEAKRCLPDLKAYYLAKFKRDMLSGRWSPTIDELIDEARRIKADGLDLSHKGPLDAELVRRVRKAKLGLYVWTVDDLAEAQRLAELGVDGITTNRAAWMRDALGKR